VVGPFGIQSIASGRTNTVQDTVGFLKGFIERLEGDIKRMDGEIAGLIAQRPKINEGLLNEEISHLKAMQRTCHNSGAKTQMAIEEFV
jgi:hypothetical protein